MDRVIAPIKDLFTKLMARFRHETAQPEQNVENARMSYTRLQALEGAGYRQCYMEKLREVSEAPPEEKERWRSEPQSGPIATVEAEAEKRRMRVLQAQHKMSYTRLQALVNQLTPEQRLMNDEEAARLGGGTFSPELGGDKSSKL